MLFQPFSSIVLSSDNSCEFYDGASLKSRCIRGQPVKAAHYGFDVESTGERIDAVNTAVVTTALTRRSA